MSLGRLAVAALAAVVATAGVVALAGAILDDPHRDAAVHVIELRKDDVQAELVAEEEPFDGDVPDDLPSAPSRPGDPTSQGGITTAGGLTTAGDRPGGVPAGADFDVASDDDGATSSGV